MSTTEPPAGSIPPPGGEPTPPPPTSTPAPMDTGTTPPPPPPPASGGAYGAPTPPAPAAGMGGAPAAASGVGQPGNLLDRFLARLIDGFIIGVVYVIVSQIINAVVDSFFLYFAITSVIGAVIFLGYFAYMESARGQTVGKQVMKLRTFGPDGSSNPTMEQAVRRNIWEGFGILGVIPIIGGMIGGLAALAAVILIAVQINSDPRRQHWFDKFAGGTQVMKVG